MDDTVVPGEPDDSLVAGPSWRGTEDDVSTAAPVRSAPTAVTEPQTLPGATPRLPAWLGNARDALGQLRWPSWRGARARWHRFGSRWLTRPIVVVLCVSIVLSTCASLAGFQYYRAVYARDTLLASQGIQHLRTAETLIKSLAKNPLDAQTATAAGKAFSAALDDFSRIDQDLSRIPAIAEYAPYYGSRLRAALDVLPLAAELAQAGVLGCSVLSLIDARLHNPLDPGASGITPGDFHTIDQALTQLLGLLAIAIKQVQQLPPSDLQADPRIAQAIGAVRAALPAIQEELPLLQSVKSVLPAVLGIGAPASYLVEQLDSTELRPGGGFIGTYGIATVSGARLSNIEMTDVDLLDHPFANDGHVIPIPPAYSWFTLQPTWSLRDSNLDADFPTAARYAEQIYHTEGGTVPVQGVIAITPWLIQKALVITGPIYVSEYHETVTAQNLIDRIHYHQLKAEEGADYIPDPSGHSSLRKRFTSYLFEHFMARLRQIAPKSMPQLVSLALDSLRTKDLQIYVNAAPAENLLQHHHVASTIEAPPGDSLFIVDANVISNKANNFITYTLSDQVTIDGSGAATHHATLTYAWPISQEASQNNYGVKNNYLDYLRIYTPPGSVLRAQTGWTPRDTGVAFGRQVWGGFFSLAYGQTLTITLTWTVPHAATHDASGWHYRSLIQRQAGIIWKLALQVSLPACATINGKPLPLVASSHQRASLRQPGTADLDLSLNYTC
jgi:hypothetical protein